MAGKILVCLDCWMKANPVDRATFRSQYLRTPNNPQAWSAIAGKILRTLGAP